MEDLKKQIKKFPNEPGVYFFRDAKKRIIYIGKATALKSRVNSYFSSDLINTRGQRIVKMVEEAESITFEKTDSVLEALVLEAHLIKKHQPKYNAREKDNKSYNYVVITKEDFPRVLIIRERELLQKKYKYKIKESFGPFTQGASLKEALKIIRKIFPYRDKCELKENNKTGRGCFNYQLGLCPGTCIGEITKTDYAKTIRHIGSFLKGKKKDVLRSLKLDMAKKIKSLDFEDAEKIKRMIFSLMHIQDVSLIKEDLYEDKGQDNFRIESYDIAHMAGENVVGVMVVLTNGEVDKKEYKKFNIKGGFGNNDTASLKEILERRLLHAEWQYPNLIVIDGGKAQLNSSKKILEKSNLKIPVVSVVKDDRHKAREILGEKEIVSKNEKEILLSNAEAHRFAIKFFREKQRKSVRF